MTQYQNKEYFKNIPTIERWSLLETCCSKMDSSTSFLEKIALRIKSIGTTQSDQMKGSQMAEAEAKKIRLMLESGKTETEILKELGIE